MPAYAEVPDAKPSEMRIVDHAVLFVARALCLTQNGSQDGVELKLVYHQAREGNAQSNGQDESRVDAPKQTPQSWTTALERHVT